MSRRVAEQDPRVGALLHGRYRLTSKLGEGSMGVVYRGERLGLGRPVAVKFLREGTFPLAELRRRFEIEAKAASRMCHQNCVPVIDAGLHQNAPFVVMPFVVGRNLRDILDEGSLEPSRALRLMRQILAGLAHAHEHGIVHRDLKPENILVTVDGHTEHAQITDFGLAKIEASSLDHGIAVGTPGYMAPEQTYGLPVDARADVYSAGILLFELLADRKPFIGENPYQTLLMHRDAPVPTFAEIAPDRVIPEPIEAVVRRALEKHPPERYASASELDDALEAAIQQVETERTQRALDRLLAERRGRGPLQWLSRAAAVIAAIAVAAATMF